MRISIDLEKFFAGVIEAFKEEMPPLSRRNGSTKVVKYGRVPYPRQESAIKVPKLSKSKQSALLLAKDLKDGFSFLDPSLVNRENWVTLDQVMSKIRSYSPYNGKIQIEVYGCLENQDKIFILPLEDHLYVLLYIAKERLVMIADGGNDYILCSATRRKVGEKVSKSMGSLTVEAVQYNQQKFIDHCGASAVLLAIEFTRLYHSGEWKAAIARGFVTVHKSLLRTVTTRLHKSESLKIEREDKSITTVCPSFKCKNCGKTFRGLNRTRYVSHQAHCRKQE